MSADIVFIKNINDLNYYNSLKPHYKYRRVKFSFKCSRCGKISIKNLESIHNNFLCNSCSCSSAFNNIEVQNKKKQTCLIKYGCCNVAQNKIVKEKSKQTCLIKYGTEYSFQSNIVKQKSKETKLQKYGISNYVNSEKAKETCLKRYGVSSYTKTQECQNKIYKTLIEKYGNNYIISKEENKLFDYINSIYTGIIIKNNRIILQGKELDIYLPEIKLAFEYDGTYWHADKRFYTEETLNEQQKSRNIWQKDKEKDLLCEKLGIILVRIKEYDWINNNDYEKQRILDILYNYNLQK